MPSILATFNTIHKALQAQQELLDEGFETVQVDRVSEFPTEPISHINDPLTDQAAGLTSITQTGGDELSPNARPLAAADIASSGMAGAGGLISPNILLTVVTDEKSLSTAKQIIENNEGEV
ncbi:MAG: hypothetical protein SCK28_15700 [Bacillota bacterium]|nr:hypothetical protein [Bacillota bacterium]